MGKADLKELAEKLELDVELSGATSAQRRAMKKALADLRKEAAPEKGKNPAPEAKKITYKADDIITMSDEELDEVIEKHDLTIKDGLNLRKKRAAVTDALEETDLLVEEE
jgi:acyl-CoA reductase-like NAD-dependent aldehyde dehydrogenase